MTYGFLYDSVWHPPLFQETVRAANDLPSEIELQALWFSGAFGREFTTVCGRPIRIVQFGEWNRGTGPDFSHAAVEIDGVTRNGPLEIDPDAAAWEQHGHAADPNFRDTILHVVFRPSPAHRFTRTCDHRDVPQILVPGDLLDEALNRPPRETAIAHPGRCLQPLRRMPAASVERLLTAAAKKRATAKALRLQRVIDAHGPDAGLYQAVAETLGYRHNTLPMRLLAQRAPLHALQGKDAHAILFGTAGFLSPDLHADAPEDIRAHLASLWDTWWKHRSGFDAGPERSIRWRTHGQRPANHPHRRVAALAAIAGSWPRFRKLATAAPFRAKPVVDFLHSLKHPLWSRRHTLTSAPTTREVAVFGRATARELLANHLLPLARHQDRVTWREIHKIRTSQPNEKVKRCAIRLFGDPDRAAPWLRRLCHHQALLQIYHDFCLEDTTDCEACPFPEQLAQWR